MLSFENKASLDKLKDLLILYNEFKDDDTSSLKAETLSLNSWHLTDWVFEEFKSIHLQSKLGEFREQLYPKCLSLKIMHDLATGAKHNKISHPKASIKLARKHDGDFNSDFSRDFDVDSLEIEMDDGRVLDFIDEIELVIKFWIKYFNEVLKINVAL